MNEASTFRRIARGIGSCLLAVILACAALWILSMSLYSVANKDFVFVGPGGALVMLCVISGALLGWLAVKLVTRVFRRERHLTSAQS
jgi:cell division protein FtsX